mgnify:CR=1 FL=1|jgi:hypothetical protein
MTETDRKVFLELIADVYAFYGKPFSRFVGDVWWTAMQPFDLAAVSDALGRHAANPDAGQFLPKPADVVRMLQGSTQDGALVAWAKVDRAVRQVGTHQSVVFDDPLIHRVLHDMGGWVPLGTRTEQEWPFVAREFENRYRGYRMRSAQPDYPPRMIGIAEAQNTQDGRQAQAPVLIGDHRRARDVLAGGTQAPLLAVHRLSAEDLGQTLLPAPERAA